LLLSLPTYKFDYPSYVTPFAEDGSSRVTRHSGNKIRSATTTVPLLSFSKEALDKAVATGKPALFNIQDFDNKDTLACLFRFASLDKHTFCSSNGSHGGTGLKLSAVLNNTDKRNLHRIEDGIYPEKAQPQMLPTDLLNLALPADSPLLTAWLDTKAFVDAKFPAANMNHDPETRAFLIATGNCSALVGTHRNGGVLLDSNGAVVPPHYDDYAGIAFLAAGEKTFSLCSPHALDIKTSCNANINERHDVDPEFCEEGLWHVLKMRAGCVAYIPMHWWHQVLLLCALCSCCHPHAASAHEHFLSECTGHCQKFLSCTAHDGFLLAFVAHAIPILSTPTHAGFLLACVAHGIPILSTPTHVMLLCCAWSSAALNITTHQLLAPPSRGPSHLPT
jgi:hypothetical protein